MRLSTIVFCVFLIAFFGGAGKAQSTNPFNFFPSCPEGCRDVDKIVSCGSVEAAASCNMAVNGDVTMSCQDGHTYTLTTDGCGTEFDGDSDDWAVATIKRISNQFGRVFWNANKRCLEAAFVAIALYFTLVGFRTAKLTGCLVGILSGSVVGLSIATMAHWNDLTGVGLTSNVVLCSGIFALLYGMVGSAGPRRAPPLFGFTFGMLVSCLYLFLWHNYHGDTTAPIADWYIVVFALGVIFGLMFSFSWPLITFSLLLASGSAVLVFVAVLTNELGCWPVSPSLCSIDDHQLFIAAAVAAVTFLLCLAMQAVWIHQAKKKQLAAMYEEQHYVPVAGGGGGAEEQVVFLVNQHPGQQRGWYGSAR